jgi:hypothetical protein
MATKPDGSAARTERVTFTKPAAERIAKVVRTVEGGGRDAGPLTYGARVGGGAGGSQVKFATYTATVSWLVTNFTSPTTGTHVMQIRFLNDTAATAVCMNHLAFLPRLSTVTTAAQRTIVVMKEAGQWRLIGAQS